MRPVCILVLILLIGTQKSPHEATRMLCGRSKIIEKFYKFSKN